MSDDIATRISRLMDQLECAGSEREIALIKQKLEVLRGQQPKHL